MRTWVAVAIVVIIILLIYHRETFAGGAVVAADIPAGGHVSIAIADVALPAHNSGKPSLWVPAGLRPEYYWRRVVYTQ